MPGYLCILFQIQLCVMGMERYVQENMRRLPRIDQFMLIITIINVSSRNLLLLNSEDQKV